TATPLAGTANFQRVNRSSPTSVRVRHVTRSSASGARCASGCVPCVCAKPNDENVVVSTMKPILDICTPPTPDSEQSAGATVAFARGWPRRSSLSDVASGGGQREHMVALRFHLSFLPMERVLPDRIGATAPRRAGGERHVLTPSNFVHRRN